MMKLFMLVGVMWAVEVDMPTMDYPHRIQKGGMLVGWKVEGEKVSFRLTAPDQGWVAIGFNETPDLTGNYLLMGRVKEGKAELREFYVFAPGDYRPIDTHKKSLKISGVGGTESKNETQIEFSLDGSFSDQYRKAQQAGKEIYLLLAFSESDDFKHHSRMRTTVKIRL